VKPTTLEILFWLSAGVIAYVYAGFPALLYFFARKGKPVVPSESAVFPEITLLISAYNEKTVIAEKLQNALALDYPRERLEIIVISDCSDDGTDEIVASFSAAHVRLVRQEARRGKSEGLNLGVACARGDILAFSDANSMYQPDAIRNLARHFADPRIGYVVGNCAYSNTPAQPASAESEGLYWKLETWLKEKESDFGSVVGGDGAIYAIRRDLFSPLRATDINDFLNPLQIIVRGFRGIYDGTAICHEQAGDSFEKEFHRKVRIISRSLNAVRRAWPVLLPWTQPRHWLALVSHKVLRWFIPVFLLLALLTSLFLWRLPLYRFVFILQIAFYGLATAGWMRESQRSTPRVLYLPYYFCLVNLASLLGIGKFLRGSLSPTWQTIRHEPSSAQDSGAPLAKGGS
jgi:cellulose synthase/poly-beta-1,6-N-acetylglucosamine synthase-like glycosyltransferase